MQKEKSRQLLKKKSKTSNPTRSHSFIRIPLQTEIRRHNLIKRFKRKVNKLNKQLNSFYGQKKISIDIGCQTDIQIEKNQSSISNATTEPKNEIEQQIDEQKLITTEGIADDEDFSILSPIIGDEVRYSDSSAKDNLLSQENPDFHSTFVKPSTTSRQNSYPIQKETEYLSETCLDSSSFTLSQFSSTSTKNQTLLDQNISPSALNESHLQSQQPFDRLSTHSPSTHSSLNSNLSNITSSSDSSAASDLSENASKIPSQTDFFQQQQMLPKHMAPIHVSSDVIATPLQLPRPTNNKASSPSSQLSPSSSSFSVSQKELKAQLPSPSFFNIHLTPLPPPPPPPPFNLSYFTSTSLPDKKYTDYFPFQQKISIESSPSSMKIASDSSHDNIEPLPTTKLNTQNFNTRKIYTDTSFSASTYSPSHSVENTPNNLSNENTLNKTKHSAPVNHLLYPLDTPPSEMIKRDLSKKAHHQNTSSLIRSSFQTLHKERTNTGTPMVDSSLPEQKQRRTRESISEQEEQKSFVDINESDDIASVEREIDKGFADYENEDELFFESKEKRKYRKSNPQSMQKEADIFNEKGKDFSSYEVKERITDSNRKKKQAEAEKLLWQKWKEKEDAYWDSQFAGGSFL
ncbi:uncharacterized protein MONOS_10137 [Monocercomonoides exilis]|uniref:uncharacterized protein n=1 Tax=Monocercomonoides exilis TaxID=2049356 RepID=UPI003559B6C8|nr:hypothetical protein MONOS_10137 [Monocercomonoides exilis]|eukprot:MONOS_10137.1-p1 / transcript=MONOS_10137.1 / gene=MONOS_10137 / organism=Monocercomonoides_exilis_PA203 / gene_product=unspecified product / transcript_product=unspecified product / location=Mono_scaffold00448:4456-6345(+) / protein_length=630 / sequence_SO=supercontig / SO=protein_coding / is_pseudo=false